MLEANENCEMLVAWDQRRKLYQSITKVMPINLINLAKLLPTRVIFVFIAVGVFYSVLGYEYSFWFLFLASPPGKQLF